MSDSGGLKLSPFSGMKEAVSHQHEMSEDDVQIALSWKEGNLFRHPLSLWHLTKELIHCLWSVKKDI